MRKNTMKRAVAAGIAAMMTVGLLAGCGNSGKEASSSGSEEDKKVTIEMWHHISPDQSTVLLQMIDEFQELHPNIKVETQSVAFAELKKQLSIGVAAEQLPDVTLCDTVDNASFAAMGAAVDITDEVNEWGEIDNYFAAPADSTMYEGRYYGVPYYSNCLAIMYNKDIFDEMGIAYPTSDWTCDDFKEVVEKTTTPDHYGLTMSLVKSEEGTFNVIPFIWQAGADYDSLDSPEAAEALTMINDFYQKGYMSKELISMTQADMCASLFIPGKSAMMVGGTWLRANIKNENPDMNYGVVTFAKNKNAASPIGGGNIMMMKEDNKEASWELMKFLSEKDNSRRFSEDAGYISAREDAVADSELWSTDPILSVYAQQLKEAKARGPHPKWPEISSAMQFAIQDTLSGAKTPEEALKEAATEIDGIK
ncbi:MAG: ABC transporter substrate-binding protein [Hespellia sp.]|nr:ABC transporter substrate-binding protein [Hespellia sp.]